MKSLILALFACFTINAKSQCVEWMKTLRSVNEFSKRVEKYLGVRFYQLEYQSGTSYKWLDSSRTAYFSCKAQNDTGAIKEIVFRGYKSKIQKLIDDLSKEVPVDCIKEKGRLFMRTKQFDLDITQGEWSPDVDPEPKLTVWIYPIL